VIWCKKFDFFWLFWYFGLYYEYEFYFFLGLMKNKILSYLFGWFFAVLLGFWGLWCQVSAANCSEECNWIKLNTCFPIIWNCISTTWWGTNPTEAFPTMIWALTKIVMSLILVVCFILIIVAGIMRASDNPWSWKWWWAKWLMAKVAITILLLWFSWVILRLINPNFFG